MDDIHFCGPGWTDEDRAATRAFMEGYLGPRTDQQRGILPVTKHPELFSALCEPFEAGEVKQRTAPGGRQLSYITARTAMNRLDSVLGPESWWDEYVPLEHSVICKLTIILPDGREITKCDAGGYAGMADQGDDDKSGYSDAFKRACAKFGIARYLYKDGVPSFVREIGEIGDVPPAPARPPANGHAQPPPRRDPPGPQPAGNVPRSGKGLFAWVKEQENDHGHKGLLNYLNGWAKLQELPGRMVDWDDAQVALGYAEAVRKLKSAEIVSGQPAAPPRPTGDPVVDILRLRKDLIAAVWKVARKARGEHAGNDVYWEVMAGLDNAVLSGGGALISDLETCNDPEAIRAYIAAAGEAWKFAAGGTAA